MKLEYKYRVGLVVAVGLFMAVLDSTIVNVALTAMQRTFNVTINDIQWVVTAYFLAQAAVIPPAGYFATRFGTKRMYLGALAVFTVGSLLCGLTGLLGNSQSGDTLLIVSRIIQGIGGGMLFPLGTAITFAAFPPEERGSSSAVVAVPVLIAPALGPIVGGLLVDSSFAWPSIFFINVPVGILALFLVARIIRPANAVVPAGAPVGAGGVAGGRPGGPAAAGAGGSRGGFDFLGLALSMVGVTVVAYAFALVSQTRAGGSVAEGGGRGELNGWGYPPVWILLAVGLAMLASFAVYELRVVKDPVLDLRLFKTYDFTVSSVMTWVLRATVFGSFFLIPLFLQQFRGLTAFQAGLITIGQGVGSIVGIISGSRLYDRIGPRALVLIGVIMMTVSTFMLVGVQPDSDWQFFAPILFLRGIAFGWGNLPLQTVALAKLTGRDLPKASSLYNATAQVFSSIGISVVSTLLVQRTVEHAGEIAHAAVAAGSRPPANIALLSGTEAMRDVFLILGIGTALTIFIGLLLPPRSLKQDQDRARSDVPQEAGRAAPVAAEA